MEFHDLAGYINAAKETLVLLKSAYSLLPNSKDKEDIERRIRAAEEIMKRSDAQLAKELGYFLCQCEFPPHPMLWRAQERAWVCPNPDCGQKEYASAADRPSRDDDVDDGRSKVTGY